MTTPHPSATVNVRLHSRRALCAALLWGAAWGCAAKSTGHEPLGNETHWLDCGRDSQCGTGQICECGVCLAPCSTDAECNAIETGAVCLPPSESTLLDGCTAPSPRVCVPSTQIAAAPQGPDGGLQRAARVEAAATPNSAEPLASAVNDGPPDPPSPDPSATPSTSPEPQDGGTPFEDPVATEDPIPGEVPAAAEDPTPAEDPMATEDSGSPPNTEDSASGVGRIYLLDIPESSWSEPRGLGEELGPFAPLLALRVDTDSVTVTSMMAGGEQDECSPTTVLPATAGNFGGAALPLHIRHISEPGLAVNATLRDVSFTGLLDANGNASTNSMGGEMTFTLDMRDLYPLFTLLSDAPTPEDVCSALHGGLGAPCEACPHDGAAYCLPVRAVQLSLQATDTVIVDNPAPSCPGASD